MARNYIHIQQYEEEIMELREQGLSLHQIGDRLGFSVKQLRAAKRKEKVTGELQLHSDQGVQYTSPAYYNLTKSYNITPSMSRRGNPYDNALAENLLLFTGNVI